MTDLPLDCPIETPRLKIRLLAKRDVSSRYVDWLNDPEVNLYLETRFDVQTAESCTSFVEKMISDSGSHLFGLFDIASGQHIGNIKLGPVRPAHGSAQLSLFIGEKAFWGKGLASEAIAAVTRWGFSSLGLHRIEAGCYEPNHGSKKAFERVGYTVEGFFRDAYVCGDTRCGGYWMAMIAADSDHV